MTYTNPHAPACPWYDITEAQGAANIKWCEETLCQWISEPANTWSNLGYIILGLVMTYISIKKNHGYNLKQFGPIIFLMGAGSFYYHLSNFYTSQIVDFLGMFLFVGWTLGMNLIRMGKLKPYNLMRFYLTVSALCIPVMHVMYLKGWPFQLLIILFGFLIIGTEVLVMSKKNLKWFIAAVVTISVAFSFSFSDKAKIWCHPENHGLFSQGHAIWHWLGSIAMLFIFLHYAQPALHRPKK